MVVKCERCDRHYDDATRWTICPHGPLWAGPGDYCRKCDVVKGMYGGRCLCETQVTPQKEATSASGD